MNVMIIEKLFYFPWAGWLGVHGWFDCVGPDTLFFCIKSALESYILMILALFAFKYLHSY